MIIIVVMVVMVIMVIIVFLVIMSSGQTRTPRTNGIDRTKVESLQNASYANICAKS